MSALNPFLICDVLIASKERLTAMEAMAHPYFNPVRDAAAGIPVQGHPPNHMGPGR